MSGAVAEVGRRVWGGGHDSTDTVVVEAPVALVYNGISHAVMMATPTDLEDLALGFSLSEQLIASPGELLDVEVRATSQGIEVAMTVTGERFAALKARRRQLAGRTGCGLCGVEALAQLAPAPVAVNDALRLPHQALQAAQQSIAARQPLKQCTGGVHAAAWCNPEGRVLLVREDVGRHNALDKLLGACARSDHNGPGFVLVTSRASYEMVTKAASCGVELLAAVSAPTSLAIDCAAAAGLTLVAYLQQGRHAVYGGHGRLIEEDT